MNSLAQILASSLGLTLLPRATAILAKGYLLAGNGSGCAVSLELVAVPSVRAETSFCTDASTSSVSVATGAWLTARDIFADRACTSTVIRFCGGVAVTDSAVSSVSSEALGILDFDQVVGAERFFFLFYYFFPFFYCKTHKTTYILLTLFTGRHSILNILKIPYPTIQCFDVLLALLYLTANSCLHLQIYIVNILTIPHPTIQYNVLIYYLHCYT